ncbi:TBC1 domain family member 1 isoform X3 [Nilaparvata lugens]|uniref:TBC1 domain family member 1 isoform X3 n=1 Tax=Nilaparvata lugens TaxID=108931 RepID=UPI00193D5667|nr:TBC1 domain family member 1 isoform X3 [Nilaparvata lugens]
MKLYQVQYLGFATADRLFSIDMVPWVTSEIRRAGTSQQIKLGVHDGHVKGWKEESGNSRPIFSHSLLLVSKFRVFHGNVTSFTYVVADTRAPLLYCHLFETTEPDDVMELYSTMKDQSSRAAHQPVRSLSSAASLTSLCSDISPSSSHFFEVFYVGRKVVRNGKVPDTFIDDIVAPIEADEKLKIARQCEENERRGSQDYILEQPETNNNIVPVIAPSTEEACQDKFGSVEALKATNSESTSEVENPSEEPVRMRKRSGSACSVLLKKPDNFHQRPLSRSSSNSQTNDFNRTMVFLIGRYDVRLISPDKKTVLLCVLLKNITNSVKGSKFGAHFGFICKDTSSENHIWYIFKCQSESVADDVVRALNQSHSVASDAVRRERQSVVSCEHCPMVWYHRLCKEVDGLSDKKVEHIINKRLELLPEEEQEIVLTKVGGAENQKTLKEQNELMMMLLRAHCESKQGRHVHDTAENRHEFLNQYLGGSTSTIFMKAKRSLTSSFDQLLKRKGSRDDLSLNAGASHHSSIVKELSLPNNATLCKITRQDSNANHLDVPPVSLSPRSSTISRPTEEESNETTPEKGSSMMDIFLKVGSSPKSSSGDESPGEESNAQQGSWRQAIFKTVVTPGKPLNKDSKPKGKDKAELRNLWKKAINQQILLARMEKENSRQKADENKAAVRRIKLEYEDLGTCVRENMSIWDNITNKDARKCDPQMVRHAIRQGVPKSKRGDLWLYLAEQYCASKPPFDASKFPNYNVPYENLLRQLTSHQHAILIELGRTFPKHQYFSSPLGPGQLALFNLLKAYSLLDPEVGYCQGLSFVAGVLLLHMSEDQAFRMLRHLMFRRQLRELYLPDMTALQVHLYQLSRLLRDTYPDLYAHFNAHEINPSLYAAPWLLTFFASQFPLGFVARVFDLLFVESGKVLFRVALALLGQHKENLLKCENFEQIMDYLKITIPNIDKTTVDSVMRQVFNTDVSKKLFEYGVEYHVLQEEMSTPRPEIRKLEQMEVNNKSLMRQNRQLVEQLEIAKANTQRLETTRTSHMMTINKLESQVRSLEVTVSTLGSFIQNISYTNPNIEMPSEIVRIITQLNNSERRKSLQQGNNGLVQRNLPLKSIDNSNGEIGSRKNPLKPTMSSPVLSPKGSTFFANSHNHIAQQKLGKYPADQNVRSMSDSQCGSNSTFGSLDPRSEDLSIFHNTGKKQLLNLRLPEGSELGKKYGRVLTDEDKKKLRLTENNDDVLAKSNSMPLGEGKKSVLKSSQSSYELGKSESMSSGIHPLDACGDVSISFGGTTKLKTIRPSKSRHSSTGSIPSPSASTTSLFATSDESVLNNQIELKIVESQDLVNENSPTNSTYSAKKNLMQVFNKASGKEAELMIQSQRSLEKERAMLT